MTIQDKITLIRTKVEILKIKANDYEWQCHVPKQVREELENALIEIGSLLKQDPSHQSNDKGDEK